MRKLLILGSNVPEVSQTICGPRFHTWKFNGAKLEIEESIGSLGINDRNSCWLNPDVVSQVACANLPIDQIPTDTFARITTINFYFFAVRGSYELHKLIVLANFNPDI